MPGFVLGFPTGRDSATFWDSGTGKTFLSRDKGTTGQRDREIFLSRDKGTTGRPVPVCPGTSRGTSRPLETLLVTLSLLTCWMQISVTKSLHCIVMKNVNSPASIGRVFTVQAIFYPRLGSCKKNDWSEYKEQKL